MLSSLVFHSRGAVINTFSGIANKIGVALCLLKAANPQITNFNFITPNQTINIQPQGCGTLPCATSPITSTAHVVTATCAVRQNATYTVTVGDLLLVLADKFGITLDSLEADNLYY